MFGKLQPCAWRTSSRASVVELSVEGFKAFVYFWGLRYRDDSGDSGYRGFDRSKSRRQKLPDRKLHQTPRSNKFYPERGSC